jgi:hypothetical protein
MKYIQKAYKSGFSVRVTPESETASVMNYLTTGYPLAGHSLDGVSWSYIEEDDEYKKIKKIREKALERSMRVIQPPHKEI